MADGGVEAHDLHPEGVQGDGSQVHGEGQRRIPTGTLPISCPSQSYSVIKLALILTIII